MPSKVLVVGNAGQLGRELMVEFAARGHSVTGVDRAEVDITTEGKSRNSWPNTGPTSW
jgi:dTDP-4-dehydrorhamnose reductase